MVVATWKVAPYFIQDQDKPRSINPTKLNSRLKKLIASKVDLVSVISKDKRKNL